MTPNQLRQLLVICEQGSLRRAAAQLRISEPALSKGLAGLEAELGVRLLERTPRGMIPTLFGEALVNHARVIHGEFQRAVDTIEELKSGGSGHLSIGFSPGFIHELIVPTLCRFRETYPSGIISTTHGSLSALAPLILRREVDLAVVTLRSRAQVADLAQITLGTSRTVPVARSMHPVFRQERPSLAGLLSYPWILPKLGDYLRYWLEQRFTYFGLTPPQPVVEYDFAPLALDLIAQSDLISFVPSTVLRAPLGSENIRIVPVPELMWDRTTGVIHHQNSLQAPMAQAFVQMLKDASQSRMPSPELMP